AFNVPLPVQFRQPAVDGSRVGYRQPGHVLFGLTADRLVVRLGGVLRDTFGSRREHDKSSSEGLWRRVAGSVAIPVPAATLRRIIPAGGMARDWQRSNRAKEARG